MEYRQLGGSGFKVPVLSLGTGTFGGGGEFFKAWGADRRRRGDPARRHLPRRRADHVRLGRHLLQRGWPRRSWARPSRAGATRCSSRPRRRSASARAPTTSAPRALHLIRAVEGSLQRLGHRLHRPLPAARLRRDDARRGSPGHARRPGPRGQDPLHRLLQLLGLASDEVAGRLREIRPGPVRRPPGVLLADRPRLRVGADAPGAWTRRSARSSGARWGGAG